MTKEIATQPPRVARRIAKAAQVQADWNSYDRAFRAACAETCRMIEADPEIRRMAFDIATAPTLADQKIIYDRVEENIDRKIRGVISARELGSRFTMTSPSITMVAVLNVQAEALSVNLSMRWRGKVVRVRLDAAIDLDGLDTVDR